MTQRAQRRSGLVYILLATLVIGAAGCQAPVGTYRVVDARTGEPISDAAAVLYLDPSHPGPYASVGPTYEVLEEAKTDTKGSVQFSRWEEGHMIELIKSGYRRTRWHLYPVLADGPLGSGTIRMEAGR